MPFRGGKQNLNKEEIKLIKKLQMRKYRDETGIFVGEGVRLASEALREDNSRAEVQYVVTCKQEAEIREIFGDISERGKDFVRYVPPQVFDAIAETRNSQGVLVVCKIPPRANAADIAGKSNIVMCDGISEPGNLGTIIRTAECAGVEAVALSAGCADPYGGKVVRATMGAIFRLLVMPDSDLPLLIREGKFRGIAACVDGDNMLYDADLSGKTAIVVGSEARGISENVLAECETRVKIPIFGGESLNVSIATGVIIYEKVRRTINL
jgi:TrmH family RNA methyltransferase